MKNQQGAALVIVLALLAGSLMIGISGMNSALIDERLAGNYRAAALAQMNAERAASDSVNNESFTGDGSDEGQDYWEGIKPNENLLLDEEDINTDNWKDIVRGFSYEEIKNTFNGEGGSVGYITGVCDDKVGNTASYNRCLYFPVYIDTVSGGSEWYVIAVGAVENEQGDLISQSSPIFLRVDSDTNADGDQTDLPFTPDDFDDIISAFDKLGMLAGDEIDIDNNGRFDFYGQLQAGNELDTENNFNFQGEGSGEIGEGDKADFPTLDFDAIIEEVRQQNVPFNGDDEDCVITLSGDQEGKTNFCDGDIELSGNFSNTIIVANGDVEIKGDATLENVIIISNEDIENDGDKNDFTVRNSFFFAKDGVDLDLKGKNTIDGLWIYSGDDIDIDIKGGGNEEWVGGLMAKEDIDFDTNGRYNFRQSSASAAFSEAAGGGGSGSGGPLTVVSWEN